jgi:hypothetical protein
VDKTMVSREALAAAQALRRGLLAATSDPVILIGSTLARSYPLPADFDSPHAIAVAARGPRAEPLDFGTQVQELFNKALSPYGFGTASASGDTAKRVRILEGADARTTTLAPHMTAIQRLTSLHRLLSEFERQALFDAAMPGLSLSLRVSDNSIDTTLAGATSGAALLVWDDERDTGSTLVLSANRLRNRAQNLPTALILMTEANALSGNLILNEESGQSKPTALAGNESLLLYPGASGKLSAINGNVLKGSTNLGSLTRPGGLTGDLSNWLFANTVL